MSLKLNLSSILISALTVAGVADAEMLVSLILSNNIDLNSLIEEIIISDEGLALVGIEKGPTSGIFRDYLIQALAAKAAEAKPEAIAYETPRSKPTQPLETNTSTNSFAPLTWSQMPQQNNASQHKYPQPQQQQYIPILTPSVPTYRTNTNSNYIPTPSSISSTSVAWGPNLDAKQTKQTKQTKQKHTKQTSYQSDLSASSAAFFTKPTKSKTKTATTRESEINFLASMFDLSIDIVQDIYYQCKQSIEQSVTQLMEILNHQESNTPNNDLVNRLLAAQNTMKTDPFQNSKDTNDTKDTKDDNNNQQNNESLEFQYQHDQQDALHLLNQTTQSNVETILTPSQQLSALFPNVSQSNITKSLQKYSNDLELAAAHLLNQTDIKTQQKNDYKSKQLIKKLTKAQSNHAKQFQQIKIPIVLSKRQHTSTHHVPSSSSSSFVKEEIESVEFLHQKMEDCFRRAAQAFAKGNRGHAGILSEDGRKYRSRRTRARERDARIIFQHHNPNISLTKETHGTSMSIDLHGLQKKEAIQRVKQAISNFSSESNGYGSPRKMKKYGNLDIVTGKGKHSLNKKSKLIPAVQKWLQQNEIEHQVYSSKGYIRAKIKI